jgi:hypothetical protein
MTEAERKSIVRELERLGWIYNPRTDRFCDVARELEWKHAIGLIPGLKLEDLMSSSPREE